MLYFLYVPEKLYKNSVFINQIICIEFKIKVMGIQMFVNLYTTFLYV